MLDLGLPIILFATRLASCAELDGEFWPLLMQALPWLGDSARTSLVGHVAEK